MAITIGRVTPFAIRKVAVSPGGAGQVTVVEFTGFSTDEVITIVAETAALILQEGSPEEGTAYDDDLAFPVPIGGFATFPVAGWGKDLPRILLASDTAGAVVRIMVAKKA